jgi:hypothetical protein
MRSVSGSSDRSRVLRALCRTFFSDQLQHELGLTRRRMPCIVCRLARSRGKNATFLRTGWVVQKNAGRGMELRAFVGGVAILPSFAAVNVICAIAKRPPAAACAADIRGAFGVIPTGTRIATSDESWLAECLFSTGHCLIERGR